MRKRPLVAAPPSPNGRDGNVTPRGGDFISCDSSNGSTPRRRLELEDEGSQSVFFESGDVVAAGVDGNVTYDPCDHTVAFLRNMMSSHMMVLPRALFSHHVTDVDFDALTRRDDNILHAGCANLGDAEWQRSPSAALNGAGGMAAGVSPDTAVRVSSASSGVLPRRRVASLRAGCEFVRLPHPRHGAPVLFVCPPIPDSTSAGADDNSGVVLYEVQAQGPPGGFAQTWFVDNMVEPNEELLVVTPFDVTFFSLRQAATHVAKDRFLSAEDLIMGASRSRSSGSGTQSCGWPGWGVALAQCPSLAPAVAAMQSHAVLSRICDVKSVGGDNYYRLSAERMGVWLREKVRRVANCPALRSVLQLDSAPSTAAASATGGAGAKETPSVADVPLPIAFGVVAEYVVEELADTAAELCGTAS